VKNKTNKIGMKTKIIALLPMKGTSERVPNKNLKDFNGFPLYRVVLNTLLNCHLIDKVVINTDSQLIKDDITKNYNTNVIVIDRPKNICGNYVSMNKIIEHDINLFSANIFLQTHSTNPLLKSETITEALEKMISVIDDPKVDSIFSVTRIQKRFYSKDCLPMNHDPNMLVTQHLNPIFEENSCLYIFTNESFMKNKSRIGSTPFMYEINKIEATDIDESEDFKLAEILHREL
jgi:CMP-N-acetylneuraminic acid synthetase